jgi:chorismate mutase
MSSLGIFTKRERRTMQLYKRNLAFVAAFVLGGTNMAHTQSGIDKLQSLVKTSARRLAIAEQVALAKWDSGTAVEDVPREAQVITGAVKVGESKGLDEASVSSFFRAQIEANKLVQYSLLADWRRAGKSPTHEPINLLNTIRPELDQVQTDLITELADTTAMRASKTCRAEIAEAVGKYVSAHHSGTLQAIALDRSMAAACTL